MLLRRAVLRSRSRTRGSKLRAVGLRPSVTKLACARACLRPALMQHARASHAAAPPPLRAAAMRARSDLFSAASAALRPVIFVETRPGGPYATSAALQ